MPFLLGLCVYGVDARGGDDVFCRYRVLELLRVLTGRYPRANLQMLFS